ncbi:MAG: putative nucleic acid-binding protein, contains PIN domain protein [uncultured archaeon A07HN63]|nr:MAG: putative nucleic acid-binding protein, contains PIN domain protein [uncultured archaeon A07HN63]
MTTAVDTNALLALLYDDAHADASEAALRRAYRNGQVVITPVVYAELAADGHFESAAALDEFLTDLSIQRTDPSQAALFRAGETFQQYTDRRPAGLQCPSCGTEQTIPCTECGTDLTPRQHIAADFLIGAHAAVDCERLLSFDSGFYATYFPSLAVAPE